MKTLKRTVAFVGSVEMNEYIAALGICLSFIAGFWIGVDWYRKKIIEEAIQDERRK